MPRKPINPLTGRDSQQGAALIAVLWILTILTVMVADFCYTVRTEANITRNTKEQLQAHYLARAGAYAAIADLVYQEKTNTLMRYETATDEIANPPTDTAAEGEWANQRLRLNHLNPPKQLENGFYQVQVTNLAGKINLNRAGQQLLTAMLGAFELSDTEKATIVDSILDWRDADDMHRLNGAEKDYYASLDVPYPCRDGDFASVHELLLVQGVTPELFYGGLREMVTVDPPSHKRTSAKGQSNFNQVNLNNMPEPLLKALLQGHEEDLAAIREYRQTYDFKRPSDLSEFLDGGAYSLIAPYLTTQLSRFYTIRSTGFLKDGDLGEAVELTIELTSQTSDGYRIVHWKNVVYEPARHPVQPTEATSAG